MDPSPFSVPLSPWIDSVADVHEQLSTVSVRVGTSSGSGRATPPSTAKAGVQLPTRLSQPETLKADDAAQPRYPLVGLQADPGVVELDLPLGPRVRVAVVRGRGDRCYREQRVHFVETPPPPRDRLFLD